MLFGFDFYYADSLYFFNQNFQLLFLIIVTFVLFASRDFLVARNITKSEYDVLFLFVVLSTICLCFADDFLILYLAIEILSLSFYVFATFNRHSEFSTEAGLKYFVFGGIISCFLLLGFSLVYLAFGSTNFELLFSLVLGNNDEFLFLGVIFILIALLFKVGSAPFHSWLCDVYDGSILSVTMLFASAPKLILFSIIVKLFFFTFYDYTSAFVPFFLFASLASITVGSISAIYQKRIKRLFAYSTIAHTGFILLGILACSAESSKALIFYIIVYALLTVLLFSLLIFSTLTTSVYPKYLANLTSIGLKNYLFAITFALILFSIAGIPPLAGFFSKFFVLLSIISQKYYVTGVIIVTISSVACFYYIRLIKIFFFVKTAKNSVWISNPTKQNTELLISSLLFFNVFFFFRPDLLSHMSTTLGLVLF